MEKIRRWFWLGVGRAAPRSPGESRSRSILRGTASAIVARGLGAAVSIISVPLTVRYLGSERYGIWITISTFLSFLSFTDLGLSNSLTNAIGRAYGKGQQEIARRYVSSALAALGLIALLILIATIFFGGTFAALIFPHADRTLLQHEVTPAVSIALAIFALNFPLRISDRVLSAYQENSLANLWAMIACLGNLITILLVIWLRGGLPYLVLGCSGVGLLTNTICSIWVFGYRKPWLKPRLSALDWPVVQDLFSSGWKFLVIGAAWMINSETDNLIIAHYLGAAFVTPFSIAFRLFSVATLLQTLAYPSLWPAYTEATARKDYAWIRRAFRSNFRISFAIAVPVVIALVVFGRVIIRYWAGASAVPSFSVLIWMGAWNLMLANLYCGSCLLNATGHLKGMTIYGTITAVVNLLLSILFVQWFGLAGVIAATVIAFGLANYIPTFIEVRSILRRFAAQTT